MSSALRSVKRIREFCRSIFRRTPRHEARLADQLPGRVHFPGVEQLEPRLLLSSGTLDDYVWTPNHPIQDNGGWDGRAIWATTLSGAPSGAKITDVDVEYWIDHTWVGDLRVWLTTERSGQWYDKLLWDREGGSADDIHEKETGLDNWDNLDPNGTWYLMAADYAPNDTGEIDAWKIWVHWETLDEPDLTPYQPSGWSDKIVVSTNTGDHSDDSPIFSDQDVYIDWAVTNDGDGPATSDYYTALYVDGSYKTQWNNPSPHNVGYYKYVDDYNLGKLSAGQHTIEIRADYTDLVDEKDDSSSDNNYSRTITVNQSAGAISSTLKNWDGTNAAPSKTRFVLYTSPTQQKSGSNPASFTNIPVGTYLLEGYQTGTFLGEEFWTSQQVTVTRGSTVTPTLTRNYAYATETKFYNDTTGTEILPGEEVTPGTTIRPEVTVLNNVPGTTLSSKVRLIMDRDQSTGYDYDQTTVSQAVPGSGGTRTFTLPTFTPESWRTGQFYFALEVMTTLAGGGTVRTDSWTWTQTFDVLADDTYEENDTKSITDGRMEGDTSSPNLGLLTSQRVISGLKMSDSADWYKFRMDGTGTASNFVRIDFTHSQGDLDMVVYRSDGTSVVDWGTGTSNREEVSLNGQPAGTYYVKVYGWLGAFNPSYMLTIDPASPAPSDDSYEDNDSKSITDGRLEGGANSPNLGLLTTQRVISGLKMSDIADWYRFRMDGMGTPSDFVRIDFTHAHGDLDMYVYRSDGVSVVDSGTGTTNSETVSLNGQPAGYYYVKVYGWNGATNPDYTLTIDPAPPPPADDVYENNDSKTIVDGRSQGGVNSPNLGELASPETLTGLVMADGSDWYRFETGRAGSNAHHVMIDFDHSQGDLDLRVYRADGSTLVGYSYGVGDRELVSLDGEPAGVYYVEVFGWGGATNPDYSLTIDPPQPGLAENVLETSWQLAATGLFPTFLGIPLNEHAIAFSIVNGMMETAIDTALGLLPPSLDPNAEITYGISIQGEVTAGLPNCWEVELGSIATGYNLTRDCDDNTWTISRTAAVSFLVGSLTTEFYARFDSLSPEPEEITFGFASTVEAGLDVGVQWGTVLQAEVGGGGSLYHTMSAETTLDTDDFLNNYVHQPTLAEGLADVFIPYYGDTFWENVVSWVGGVAQAFCPIIPINTLIETSRTDTPMGILANHGDVTVTTAEGWQMNVNASLAIGGSVPIIVVPAINVGASVSVGVTVSAGPEPTILWTHTYPEWHPVNPVATGQLGDEPTTDEPYTASETLSTLALRGELDTQSSTGPTVDSFTAEPSPAILGELVCLSVTASDPDPGDAISEVAFYLDDGDGIPEEGELMGRDCESADGWAYYWDTKLEPIGTKDLLAVAFDSGKTPSSPYALSLDVVPVSGNRRPSLTAFTATPNPAVRGDLIIVTADAADPDTDDSVTRVSFFEDSNGDGVADPSELLGVDSSPADGWNYQLNTALRMPGTIELLAVAEDESKELSLPRSAAVLLLAPPTVGLLTDSPDPIEGGQELRLVATDVNDVDGSVTRVEFYRDVNGNWTLEPGMDQLLGADFDGSDGWAWTSSTVGWPIGIHRYFARAQDGDGLWSNVVAGAGLVDPQPASPDVRLILLESPTAGLTATSLPGQAELHIVEDHGFYGEIWVRSNAGNPANIGGGSVNLSFNPAYGRIISVEPVNANWTGGSDGTADNTGGTLTGLTREDATPSAGDDEWVLFGRVQFSGKAPVDEAAQAFGPYDLGLDITLAEFSVSGGTYAANDAGSDDAQVYSVIYDVDDSGRILGGDFGVFSAAYRTTVGGAEPPYSTWADFDGSGKVLGGDFGMLSGVYRMYTYEIDFSQLSARYRPAEWTSGASVRVLAGGGSGLADGSDTASENVFAVAGAQQEVGAPVVGMEAVASAAPTVPRDPQSGAFFAADRQALPEPRPSVVSADAPPAMLALTLDSAGVAQPHLEASMALPARTSVARLLAVAATGPADWLFASPAAGASNHTDTADDGLSVKPVAADLQYGGFRLADGTFGKASGRRYAVLTAVPSEALRTVGTEATAVARKAIWQGKAQGLVVDLLDESEILDVLALPGLKSIAARR